MDTNLRKFPGQNAFKLGVIQIDNCSNDIECLVWNVSETGAQLAPVSVGPVPDEFELFLDEQGPRRSCFVIWREGRRIGVTFTA